ncbi:MAG: TolC family outer membrane protein [Fimbriimonadaceae bacterium]|nr:TolC family outer membrane protein [Alphaproteobacteria bacterium]
MSLKEAVQRAIDTHPSVESARFARQAAGYELRQAQGRLYPTLDLDGNVGRQRIDQPQARLPTVNNVPRTTNEVALVFRQVLFSGWDRSNDIYRNAARVDASALRVMERSESIGLTAAEAYIDVRRNMRLMGIAKNYINRLNQLVATVRGRRDGGKATQGDVNQALERVSAAASITFQIEQSLLEARAKYHSVIGTEAGATTPVYLPSGLPVSQAAALEIGLTANPTILAADADVDAALFAREQSRSEFLPEIAIEGAASFGHNIAGSPGPNEDLSARIVLSWNLFNGNITQNTMNAASARLSQAQAERDARSREVGLIIRRAWATYISQGQRVATFRNRVSLNREIVETYLEEYQLSKRTLLDLLDSENSLFQAQFQLESVSAIHIFSGYQLMASTGLLLKSMSIVVPHEVRADLREQSQRPLGIYGIEIEPLRID